MKLEDHHAVEVADWLRRKSASTLLAGRQGDEPTSETMTLVARSLPRLAKLAAQAATGNYDAATLARAFDTVLNDSDPGPLMQAAPVAGGQVGTSATIPLAQPPSVGDRVHVVIEGADADIAQGPDANGEYEVRYDDGTLDDGFTTGDFAAPMTPPPAAAPAQPGPQAATPVSTCPFQPGEDIEFTAGVSWQRGVFVTDLGGGDYRVDDLQGHGPYTIGAADVRTPQGPASPQVRPASP